MPLPIPGCGGYGNWNDASLWSTGLVPTLADDVIINGGVITQQNSSGFTYAVLFEGGTLMANGVINGDVYFGNLQASLGNDPGQLQINGNLLLSQLAALICRLQVGSKGWIMTLPLSAATLFIRTRCS